MKKELILKPTKEQDIKIAEFTAKKKAGHNFTQEELDEVKGILTSLVRESTSVEEKDKESAIKSIMAQFSIDNICNVKIDSSKECETCPEKDSCAKYNVQKPELEDLFSDFIKHGYDKPHNIPLEFIAELKRSFYMGAMAFDECSHYATLKRKFSQDEAYDNMHKLKAEVINFLDNSTIEEVMMQEANNRMKSSFGAIKAQC